VPRAMNAAFARVEAIPLPTVVIAPLVGHSAMARKGPEGAMRLPIVAPESYVFGRQKAFHKH
jgi:hypothetical protein